MDAHEWSTETVIRNVHRAIDLSRAASGLLPDPAGTYARIDANRTQAVAGGVTTDYRYDRSDALVSQTIAAATTTAFAYDGYGQTLDTYAAGTLPTPWKYQGRLDVSPDADDPLYDAGARFYSPAIGAFTQLDTVAGSAQDPWSMNRYLYAGANPSSMIDPDGHAFFENADTNTGEKIAYTVVRTAKSTKRVPHYLGHTARGSKPKPKAHEPSRQVDQGVVRTVTVTTLTVGGDLLGGSLKAAGKAIDGFGSQLGGLRRLGGPFESAGDWVGEQTHAAAGWMTKWGWRIGAGSFVLGGVMSGLEEGVKPSDKPEWQRVLHAVTKSTFSGAGTAVGGFAGGVACSETGPGAIACGAAGAWGGGQVGGWLGDLAIGTEDWLVDRVTGVFAPRAPAEPQLPLLDPTDLFQMPA